MNRSKALLLLYFLAATMLALSGCDRNEAVKTGSDASPAPAQAQPAPSGPLVVKEVVDVRPSKDPEGNPVIIGSINGTGLAIGDKVVVNNDTTLGTFFGNDKWITFSIPVATVGNQKSFTLQVMRPTTEEKSKTFTVDLKR